MRVVRLLDTALDPAAELARFAAAHAGAGGLVSFLGQVRGGEGIEALDLRHFPPLTLPGMEALADSASARWRLDGIAILHRIGEMPPAAPIVLVAAAARHRRDAFSAVDYAMDHLKSDSWFWKREKRDGAWRWIEPRAEDGADLARWAPVT